MKQPPKNIFSLNAFWGHAIGIPLFALGLLLLFCPFAFKGYVSAFGRYSFHIVMIFCIILLMMLISRMALYYINKRHPLTVRQYYFACFFEVLFASGFTALYLWLFAKKAEAYFMYFGYALVYLAVAMVIPYVILFLYNKNLEKEEQLEDASKNTQGEKIRFMDERGNVKLIVSQPSILYIQSDENYLRIYYLDEGRSPITSCAVR